MISFNACKPSIIGISTSIVTTSGFNLTVLSIASIPLAAEPTISIEGSDLSILSIAVLMKAESSTMTTRIFFLSSSISYLLPGFLYA